MVKLAPPAAGAACPAAGARVWVLLEALRATTTAIAPTSPSPIAARAIHHRRGWAWPRACPERRAGTETPPLVGFLVGLRLLISSLLPARRCARRRHPPPRHRRLGDRLDVSRRRRAAP